MTDFHNTNIERALLSSILFDPSIFEDVAAILNSDDFYLQVHKDIFSAMLTCERQELPLDEEFISKELRKSKKFDEDTIIDIISTNAISNVSAYTKEIKEYSVKRGLLTFANQIKEIVADESEDSKHSLDTIQQYIYKLSQNSSRKEFRESEEIALSTLEKIKEMKARGNTILTGIDTGFFELNKLSTGFNKGDLVIVAARPAMGKTAIVLNMVQQSLDDGNGVAFFSLEMPGEQLFLRLLSAKTSIPLQRLKVGDLGDEEWSRLSDAATTISNQNLFVDDNGMIDIHHIRSKLRKLKLKNPDIKMAVIDYLQL
ncbi:MAG: Replicative DNA helicase (EC, partial [uncultured Campylobacterales bacterium]